MKVLLINGSYRNGGTTDQLLARMTDVFKQSGMHCDTVLLRDRRIAHCHNCRACMQEPGTAPAACVQHDDMAEVVHAIESADGLVFASPTNMGSTTAIYKNFMERLAVYGHWPWGQHAPRYRKQGLRPKAAILVASSAAPVFVGPWVYSTQSQLKKSAKIVGAEVVAQMFSGPHSQQPGEAIDPKALDKASGVAQSLVRRMKSGG